MRSALAASVIIVLSVVVLVSGASRAGERAPTMAVPVKDALVKMKAAKAPVGALASVRFYGEVFDGKTVEFHFGDFSNAGRTDELIVDALAKSACAKPGEAQLKAAGALLTEFGDALPGELRGYTVGHQGKADEAAPLLLKALEQIQPLDRCVAGHPDDAGRQASRVGAWTACFKKLVPKPSAADSKKLEAIQSKSMSCMAATIGTVG